MKFFLTLEHMGLEISKRYSSYSFHPMSVKRYEDIGYYGGIQAITFVGNRPIVIFKKMWYFEIWESNLKCGISRKRLIIERNGRKFGTRPGPKVHICRVLLMPDSLSLVWGHSVHFAKFPILRFSKRYLSNNFRRIPSSLYENIAYHEGMQAITLLGNLPRFTKLMALWNFNIAVNGKTYKMWNISKTADCRAKWIVERRDNYGVLKFFLTRHHILQLEISKGYFSHNFHWSPSKLYDNIGYHDKSKCL